MTKRLLFTLSLLVLAPLALLVSSPPAVEAEEQYEEGVHYTLIDPAVRTADA